jgi:hypothetical protein
MSALSPKADIRNRHRHVRFVPEADIAGLHDPLTEAKAGADL